MMVAGAWAGSGAQHGSYCCGAPSPPCCPPSHTNLHANRYARIYNAAIKDSALGFGIFFCGFMANLVFSIWSAVCEPGGQHVTQGWKQRGESHVA